MGWRGKTLVFLVLFILCGGIFLGEDTDIVKFLHVEAATTKGVVTAESLNVRKGPGKEYDLVTQDGKNVYLFRNDEVKIMDEKNGFYKVKFTYNKKTITGYGNKAYIKLITTATPTTKPNTTVKPTVTPTAKPNVTVKPTATPKVTVKPTATPKVTEKPKATSTSTAGMNENNVSNASVKSLTKTVTGLKYTGKITASALRVRTKASTGAEELIYNNNKIRLYKGNTVTILQQKIVKGIVWYYVKFTYEKKQLKGYVLSDYVKLTFAETVKGNIFSNVKVNIRNTAGVSDDYLVYDDKRVSLKDGKSVKVLKEANANSKKWLRISFTYNGAKLKGYVLANLVIFQSEKKVTETPNPSPTINPTNTPDVTVSPTETEATETPKITSTVKPTKTPVSTQTPITKGEVNNGPLNVRLGAGKDYDRLIYKGEYVSLPIGHTVRIVEEITGKTENWYFAEFNYNGIEMKGYIMAQYVTKMESNPNVSSNIG